MSSQDLLEPEVGASLSHLVEKDKQKVSTVIDAPGIPVAHKNLVRSWFVTWMCSVGLFCGFIYMIKPFVYSSMHYALPAHDLVLQINTRGCDVVVQPFDIKKPWHPHGIQIKHWKFMGDSSYSREGQSIKVSLSTSRRVNIFRCSAVVTYREGESFENLTVTARKDHFQLTNLGPSNVAEMMAVDIKDVIVKDTLHLDILASAQTIVQGVQAANFIGNHAGGTLDVSETDALSEDWAKEKYQKKPHLPKNMKITLSDSTLGMVSHNPDLKMKIQTDTIDDTILAGGTVQQLSSADGVDTMLVTPGNKSAGEPVEIELEANNCAVYVKAANLKFMDAPDQMQVQRGSSMDGDPTLLPVGIEAMKKLSSYLNTTNPSKFAAYIALTAPHVPTGTLRLLSTSAYKAFPMAFFTIISLGMVQPEIIRIQTPIVGFDFLFPRTNKAKLSADEMNVFMDGIFSAVSQYVNTSGFPDSVWVWDPAGPESYIYEYHQAMRDRPAKWSPRKLKSHDFMPILIATYITIGLGAFVGFMICVLLWYEAMPAIMKKLRHVTLVNSASYQLQHTVELTDWAVNVGAVHYPLGGALLRWKKRAQANMFGKMVVVARKWPLHKKNKLIKVDGVLPWELPTMPGSPDQQAFLFPTHPPAKRKTPSLLMPEFEAGLFVTGMLGAGNPHMIPGHAYQFQVEAFAGDKLIEKSAWSRPINILPREAFPDIPLMLWKALCGVIPEDTFAYFLEEFCVPVADGPSLMLKLTDIRLAIVNSSLLFAGAYVGYGKEAGDDADNINSSAQYVTIAVSTGSEAYELTARDNMWEETRQMALPAATDPARAGSELHEFRELVDEIHKKRSSKIPVGKHYFVLDYNTLPPRLVGKRNEKEAISMRVGSEMHLQKMQIEARLINNLGESVGSAVYENTWEELARTLLLATDKEGSNGTTKVLTDELILNYGLSPDAVLLGNITFANSHIDGPLNIPSKAEQSGLFDVVIPGMTVLWGVPLPLKWKKAQLYGDMKDISQFDLRIISEATGYKEHQPEDIGQNNKKVVGGVLASANKVRIFMSPDQPAAIFSMKCYLQATPVGKHEPILARSPDFVVVRPVTMQEIEHGYASFCVRNNINMMKIDKEHYENTYMFDIVEREFNIIQGYRKPLPIYGNLDPEANVYDTRIEGDVGKPVVANAESYMIAGPNGIWVQPQEDEEEAEGGTATTSSPSGKKVAPKEADIEATAAKEESTKIAQVAARVEHLDIPTNLFWKPKPDWKEHLLLHYSLLPFLAVDGELTEMFERWGWHICARLFQYSASLVRVFLRVALYWVQLVILSLPSWIIFGFWVVHDELSSKLNPNLDPEEEAHTTYVFGVLVSPSVFAVQRLDTWGKCILGIVFGYFLIVIIGCFYSNFIHGHRRLPRLFFTLNTTITIVCAVTLYISCMYLTIVLVWMVMGAMIDPGPMMIYAIAIIGVMVMGRSIWTNTKTQRDHIKKQLSDKLDRVTNVMMDVFVSKDAENEVSPDEFKSIVKRLVQDMRAQEKDVTNRLYKQADQIIINTDAWDKTVTMMVRTSDEFLALVGGTNKYYSTDFVDETYWKTAQELSNEDADVNGTRKPPLTTPPFSIPDELITPEALGESQAVHGLGSEGSLTQLNSDDEASVQIICKALGLRPTTGTLCHKAFKTGVDSLSSTSVDLMSPFTMACFFSEIRNDQLFRHFLWDEPPKDHFIWDKDFQKQKSADKPKLEDAPAKEGEDAAASAEETKPPKDDKDAAAAAEALATKEAQASVSAVYLLNMQRVEMDLFEPVIGDAIAKLCDWHAIGQQAVRFTTKTLTTICNHVADEVLNPIAEGSATFKVRLAVYENAYDRWPEYDAGQGGDPTLMFVHSGMVDAETAKKQECKDLMKIAIDQNRYVDGSLDATALIAAMKWATDSERGTEDISGIVLKCYLWYDALIDMLEELGWSEDEMEEKWLKARWDQVTGGAGFFQFRAMDEVSLLITEVLSDRGLWRGAAKAFMLKAKIGGYIGCDILRDGKEKAAGSCKSALWGDQTDLKFLNGTLVWPEWAENLWQNCAKPSSEPRDIEKDVRPKFMDLTMMNKFLKQIVFIEDDSQEFKESIKKSYQLNGLSADPEVQKWWKGVDQRIWYSWGQAEVKKKRVRGIWLELFYEVTNNVKCIPSDVDLYYDNIEWQIAGSAIAMGASEDEDQKVPWLNMSALKPWIKWEYIMKKRSCTAEEFHEMLSSYFNCEIDPAVLKAKVFTPCPLVPDDDLAELRFLHDLVVGLRLWMGYGLWKGAIEQAVKILLPRGKIRNLALKKLSEEFDKLDTAKIGVIQPGQAILLLKKLTHPGLTCEELQTMLKQDLNLDIPFRELHKYFTVLDANADGVLGVKEFVCFIEYVMLDYYPSHILHRMNLTVRQILEYMFIALLTFVGIIVVIKISIAAFTPGEAVGHALQTGGGAIGLALSKIQSDKRVGADEAISAVRARMDAALTLAVATTMGLAPASVDKLHKLSKETARELTPG